MLHIQLDATFDLYTRRDHNSILCHPDRLIRDVGYPWNRVQSRFAILARVAVAQIFARILVISVFSDPIESLPFVETLGVRGADAVCTKIDRCCGVVFLLQA